MTSLARCIEIHNKDGVLSSRDIEKLTKYAERYRGEKFGPGESNLSAVKDFITDLDTERADIIRQAKEQGYVEPVKQKSIVTPEKPKGAEEAPKREAEKGKKEPAPKPLKPEAPKAKEIPDLKSTGEAVEFSKVATPEQLERVKELQKEYEKKGQDALNKDELDKAIKWATKSQFMREVIEAKADPERFARQMGKEEVPEKKETKKESPDEQEKGMRETEAKTEVEKPNEIGLYPQKSGKLETQDIGERDGFKFKRLMQNGKPVANIIAHPDGTEITQGRDTNGETYYDVSGSWEQLKNVGFDPDTFTIDERKASQHFNQKIKEIQPKEAPTEVKPLLSKEKITLYRGIRNGQEGNNFYSPDKEWARQFTQSGQDKEIKAIKFKNNEIYRPKETPKAYRMDDSDIKKINEARDRGFKAIWMDEGKGEPESVYIIPKKESPDEQEKGMRETEAKTEVEEETAAENKDIYYAGTYEGKPTGKYLYLTKNPEYAKNFGDDIKQFNASPKKTLNLTSYGEKSISFRKFQSILSEYNVKITEEMRDKYDDVYKPVWQWLRKYPDMMEAVKNAGYDSIRQSETFLGKGKKESTLVILDNSKAIPTEAPKQAPQSTTEETKPKTYGSVRLDKGGVKPFSEWREIKKGKNKTALTGKIEVTLTNGKKVIVKKEQVRTWPEGETKYALSEYRELVERQRKAEGMIAAIRDPKTGKVYSGYSHQSAIDKAPQRNPDGSLSGVWGRLYGEWDRSTNNVGFLNKQGKFISRDQAEKDIGVLTMEDLRDLRRLRYSITDQLQLAPITKKVIQQAFPNAKIEQDGDLFTLALPNGSNIVVMANTGLIKPSQQAVKKGYGREATQGERAIAAWRQMGPDGMIWLSKYAGQEGVNHEAFHAAMDIALSPRERIIILKKYKTEENAAKAYGKWNPETSNTIFAKIRDFFRRVTDALFPNAEGIFRKVRSGKAFEQRAMARRRGEKYQVEAFHGGPYEFDRFSGEKIGTGEGAQAFGWGLYFTELKDIAKHYANLGISHKMFLFGGKSSKSIYDGLSNYQRDVLETYANSDKITAIEKAKGYRKYLSENGSIKEMKGMEQFRKDIESGYITVNPSRNLYKVTLHKGKQPGEYTWLDWDKKVPNKFKEYFTNKFIKESETKQLDGSSYYDVFDEKGEMYGYGKTLEEAQENFHLNDTGEGLYTFLASKLSDKTNNWNGEKEASLFLLRAGIDGIRYPAGSLSGMKDTGAKNYVVFDENAVTIEEHVKYSLKEKDADLPALMGKKESVSFKNTFDAKSFLNEKLKKARQLEVNPNDIGLISDVFSPDTKEAFVSRYTKKDGTLDTDTLYEDTGIIVEGKANDPDDLRKWFSRFQTMSDMARSYPKMARLFDVEQKRQSNSNWANIKDADVTEPYFKKINRKARDKVDKALVYADKINKNLSNAILESKFGLNNDERKAFWSIRKVLDQKLQTIVRDSLAKIVPKKDNIDLDLAVKAIWKRNRSFSRKPTLENKTKANDVLRKELTALGIDFINIDLVTNENGLADWAFNRRAYIPHTWKTEWLVKAIDKSGKEYLFEIPDIKTMRFARSLSRNAARKAGYEILKKRIGEKNLKTFTKQEVEKGKKTWWVIRSRDIPVELSDDLSLGTLNSVNESALKMIEADFEEGMTDNQKADLKDIKEKLKEYTEKLYLAKGWGKHLIPRRNVEGYKTDNLAPVIAEYIYGFNAYQSKGLAAREFAEAMRDINPKNEPEQWRTAKEYISDMLGESNEAGWYKRIVGTYFLAGDVSAGALNLSQNWTHAVGMLRTIPGKGGPTAEREITTAMKDIVQEYVSAKIEKRHLYKGKVKGLTKDEVKAMQEAFNIGILDPQFFREVSGMSTNKIYSGYVSDALKLPFKMFTASEAWNRTSTFLAAYRRAVRSGMDSETAINKAGDITKTAHFVYGKGNRPEVIRKLGTLGSISYTFMTYPVNNIMFMKHRLLDITQAQSPEERAGATKALMSNLAYVFAFGGLNALPFSFIAKLIWKALADPEDDWEKMIYEAAPKPVARTIVRGIPSVFGNDMSWRVEGTDILGAPIGLQTAENIRRKAWNYGIKPLARGEDWHTLFMAAPDIVANPYKAFVAEGGTGIEGRPPIEYEPSEKIWKAMGFTPTRESETRKAFEVALRKKTERLDKIESFAERYIQARKRKDSEKLKNLRQEFAEYKKDQKSKGKNGIVIEWKEILASAKRREKTREKAYDERLPKYMRPFQKEVGQSFGLLNYKRKE